MLVNMRSRLVITFFPRSKLLLISWLQSPSAVILEPPKIKSDTFHCFPIYFHSKHPLPTKQEKTTQGHHQMVNTEIRLIIFFAAKDGEALYSQQKQDRGADCSSDHELFIA